jgi:microcystin-dependent protein
MGTPFLAEIKIVSFGFAPKGWALCHGQILAINQNQALFALLGTTYGGNGQTTFALPDLRGRMPMHEGQGHSLGERSGEETHTLVSSELPQHSHLLQASLASAAPGGGVSNDPENNMLSAATTEVYSASAANTSLSADSIGLTGGSQAHENRQPYLALNFIIALQGVFPSRI